MTGETRRKMQNRPRVKALLMNYGVLDAVTVVLMALVFGALLLAAMIAPT